MKHVAAIAAALLLAIPATAQPVPQAQLAGVWTGTVGGQPVHACFDWRLWRGQGQLSGIYYYDRHMAPIRLIADDDTLAESEGYDSPNGARWRLDALSGTRLSATFVQGLRQVPIRLERSQWQQADNHAEACASEAFLAPRFAGGEWVEESGWFDGQQVITTNWLPPDHFRRVDGNDWDAVIMAGLQLAETQAGDAAINRQLAQQTRVADAMDCFAGTLVEFGTDGDWSVWMQPEVLIDRWLGLLVSHSNYCGGNHPNAYQDRQVFDRHSGAMVDPAGWISSAGFATQWLDPAEEGGDRIALHTITPELLNLIELHWSTEEDVRDEECREVARNALGWNIGLDHRGLAFMPELAHVAQACAETAVVPWAELEPYLTTEGQQVAASLSGS